MNSNRILKLFPALCWMGVIFFLSSQPAQDQDLAPFFARWVEENSLQAVLPSWQISYNDEVIEVQKEPFRFVNFMIRKGAHLFSYGLLAILWWRFYQSWNMRLHYSLGLAFLTSVLYGASDEWHQSFVAGRSGTIIDVWIDALGALVGLKLVAISRYRLGKHGSK